MDTDYIKSRISITDYIERDGVRLKKQGKARMGFCPFHDNTKTPALAVWEDTGTWHCFACDIGGDIFDYVMKRRGVEFREALQIVAAEAGIDISPAVDDRKKRIYEVLRIIVAEAQKQIPPKIAKYLEERVGGDPARWGLGFIKDGRGFLNGVMNTYGITGAELKAAGVLSDNGKPLMWLRIIIPIRDARGNVIALAGRTARRDGKPKYLNAPNTAVFDKRRMVFGIDKAKELAGDTVYVVEGYFDAIRLIESGIKAVAVGGTSLHREQIEMIQRVLRPSRLIIALDGDSAGSNGTEKAIGVLLSASDNLPYLKILPEGKDPDEVVNEWDNLPEIGVIEWVLQNVEDVRDALGILSAIQSSIERERGIRRLAEREKVSVRTLKQIAGNAEMQRRNENTEMQKRKAGEDMNVVAMLISGDDWEQAALADRALRLCGFSPVSEDDFAGLAREIFIEWRDKARLNDEMPPALWMIENSPRHISEAVSEMDTSTERDYKEIFRAVLRRRQARVRKALRYTRGTSRRELAYLDRKLAGCVKLPLDK